MTTGEKTVSIILSMPEEFFLDACAAIIQDAQCGEIRNQKAIDFFQFLKQTANDDLAKKFEKKILHLV